MHLCDYVPVKRTDDFLNAQFRKIKKIRDLAEERDVDIVFLLGDVFDKARPEMWLVNKAVDAFRDFPCVIYSLVGNHDLQGCRDGVPGTALGNLFTSGVIKKLQGDTTLLNIPIRAIGHTREHVISLYEPPIPSIIFTHNLLTPHVAPFEHLLVDEVLSAAKGCFIFAGDFHEPFEKYNHEANSGVINPGVLVRTSIAEKEIDPSVIYFEASPEDLVTKTERLPLGEPAGRDVFDVLSHEQDKEEELNLKQFIDSITQTQFESQDIEKLIVEVAETSKIPLVITEEAIARIKTAKAHV